MKYNTYDIINGGPRLVEIAKQRGEKSVTFEKKEAQAIYFESIKRPKLHFLVLADLRFLC